MKHHIKVTHSSGLFSCFSQRLSAIIHYANVHKSFPDSIDSSEQFGLYKEDPSIDITNILFKDIGNTDITYEEYIYFTDQFTDYSKLQYNYFNLLINKYFSISQFVQEKITYFNKTYNINYNNLCSVLYRGNDKRLECKLATPEMFIDKASIIKTNDPSVNFFVQTDDSIFLQMFIEKFPNDTIYLKELPTISNDSMSVTQSLPIDNRLNHAIELLAAINIVSRCEYMITHSGNCGYWAALYRGHPRGIIQHFTNEIGANYGWIQ